MSEEFEKNLDVWSSKFLLEVVLLLVVGVFGIIGNLSSIIIFARIRNQLKFHRLMVTLAVYDTFCILLSIIIFTFPLVSKSFVTSGVYHHLVPKILPLVQIAMTGSVYSTIAISLERYLIVCHPFYVVSHEWSFKKYILPIITFSFVYNIPRFFELKTEVKEIEKLSAGNYSESMDNKNSLIDENINKMRNTLAPSNSFLNHSESITQHISYNYNIVPTEMRTDTYYYSIYYIWTNFLVMGLFPYFILMTLNIRTLKGLLSNMKLSGHNIPQVQARFEVIKRDEKCVTQIKRRYENSQSDQTSSNDLSRIKTSELRLAKVSLIIVFVFILCHSARWIPNVYELYSRVTTNELVWSTWVESVTNLSNFLVVLNSSVNFFIYCLTHKRLLSLIIREASDSTRRRRRATEITLQNSEQGHPILTDGKTTQSIDDFDNIQMKQTEMISDVNKSGKIVSEFV